MFVSGVKGVKGSVNGHVLLKSTVFLADLVYGGRVILWKGMTGRVTVVGISMAFERHLEKSRDKITTWSESIVHTDLDFRDRIMLVHDRRTCCSANDCAISRRQKNVSYSDSGMSILEMIADEPAMIGRETEIRTRTPPCCMLHASAPSERQNSIHDLPKTPLPMHNSPHNHPSPTPSSISYSSSTSPSSLCLASTCLLNSTISASHNSAACPLSGDALFGSPSRLCRLSNTVCVLSTADHLSFKISRQMRPLKSTFGW